MSSILLNKTFLFIGIHHFLKILPWLGWLSGFSTGLGSNGSPVRFPFGAHAWVVGQVPSRGRVTGNHTLMFLSLSLPPPIF